MPKAKTPNTNRFDVLSEYQRATSNMERSPIQVLPLDHITPGESQYRLYFGAEELESLAQVFRTHGFHGALWVEPDGDRPGYYRLISGERSWRAAPMAGLTEVPCEIITGLTDLERAELGYLANDAPKRLNAIEDTLALMDLLSMHLEICSDDVPGVLYRLNNAMARGGNQSEMIQVEKVTALFERLTSGRMTWQSFARNRLSLLNLPAFLKDAIQHGEVDGTVARFIGRLDDPAQQQALLEEAIAQNLSVREVRKRIAQLKPAEPTDPLVKRYRKIGDRLKQGQLDQKKAERVIKLMSQLEKLLGEDT